jgi:hypothetical protein
VTRTQGPCSSSGSCSCGCPRRRRSCRGRSWGCRRTRSGGRRCLRTSRCCSGKCGCPRRGRSCRGRSWGCRRTRSGYCKSSPSSLWRICNCSHHMPSFGCRAIHSSGCTAAAAAAVARPPWPPPTEPAAPRTWLRARPPGAVGGAPPYRPRGQERSLTPTPQVEPCLPLHLLTSYSSYPATRSPGATQLQHAGRPR